MARVKKSRKIGQIGVPKQQREPQKNKESQSGKPKKHKGNPSGSRQDVAKQQIARGGNQSNKDPRIGSKKPVPLVVETSSAKSTNAKKKYFSPSQELKAIEDDKQLSELLDAIDEGKSLTNSEQKYVDSKLARHSQLCQLLGIGQEAEPKTEEEDDPSARFESIDINKLK